ncbi:MAG: D-alanine--D-alanine ligase [Spirochaetaceae bacterium]|nr:D-alanine--D-alanine ligase [Spirochaetaceae bacterium]
MKRIAILYGGKSGEHEVSQTSAAYVIRNLDPTRFEPVLVGIAKDGTWYLQDPALVAKVREGLTPIPVARGARVFAAPSGGTAGGLVFESAAGVSALACEAVFPVLHGTFGEDGTIQGLLETADLPYVGAPVLGSALGMDKEKAKALWLRAGLPVVPYRLVRASELDGPETDAALASELGMRFGWPLFVKPACAGSSVGASKVTAPATLGAALREALRWDEKALVEPFVEAREIECSVLGNGKPVAYVPGEVLPTHEFYDYDAKYLDPRGASLEIPARLTPEETSRVRKIAVAAYSALELAGMARVDFFLDKRTGEILLNEVNTIPGFTSISMYPKMCEAGGLPYSELLSRLVELALERHAARAKLVFAR